jgi:hypothetical protein
MQHSRSQIIFDGAVAGVIGAIVVAIWIFLFDLARGHPLQTPLLVARELFAGGSAASTHAEALLLLAYTVLHFAVFVAIGVIGALLLEAAEQEPPFIYSLLIFTTAFEVFFIAVALFLGPDVSAEMRWWAIVVGNLLATAAMAAYFFARHPALAHNLLGPDWMTTVREGAIAGLIGAVVVAVWFLGYDLAAGRIFHIPTILGAMVFRGAAQAVDTPVSYSLVLGYSVLHFTAFVAFGVVIALLLAAAELEPMLLLGVFLLFAVFEVFFVGFVTVMNLSVLNELGWWQIIAGNILALLAMSAYFLRGHRGLGHRPVVRWAALERERVSGLSTREGNEPHTSGQNRQAV